MTSVNEQAVAGQQSATKTWSEPTLEKVEINETAAGVFPQGSLEAQFTLLPAS